MAELISGNLSFSSPSVLPSLLPSWVYAIFLAISIFAAITDFRKGKIYNLLTLPALPLGLLLAGLHGQAALFAAFYGLLTAIFLFLPCYAFGVLGAGDVKLMVALSTVLGPSGTLFFGFVCLFLGGIGSFVLLIMHKRVGAFFKEIKKFFHSIVYPNLSIQFPKLDKKIKAPFGIVIFFGFLTVVIRAGVFK